MAAQKESTCDMYCIVQLVVDVLAVPSLCLYLTVAVVAAWKRPFSLGFLWLTCSLAVADIIYAIASRFWYSIPMRNYFR